MKWLWFDIFWLGMCRQFIREFSSLDLPIFMFDREGNYVTRTLEEVRGWFPARPGPLVMEPSGTDEGVLSGVNSSSFQCHSDPSNSANLGGGLETTVIAAPPWRQN